jgi:hypothetical protein
MGRNLSSKSDDCSVPSWSITAAKRCTTFRAGFLAGIASRENVCFGVFTEGKLASYCFFAVMPTDIDAHLRFHFPPRWILTFPPLEPSHSRHENY